MVNSSDKEQSQTEPGSVLKVSQSDRQGTCTVEASGDIDLATVSQLREVLEGILASAKPLQKIAVDLRAVKFIDSAGLALLVDIKDRFLRVAPLSVVIRAGSQPDRVMKLGHFDRFIPTERDEANRRTVSMT